MGDINLVPEIIEAEEEELIKELEKIQKVSSGSPINYASDDPPQTFEIYRLEALPESYKDFSRNLITSISTAI